MSRDDIADLESLLSELFKDHLDICAMVFAFMLSGSLQKQKQQDAPEAIKLVPVPAAKAKVQWGSKRFTSQHFHSQEMEEFEEKEFQRPIEAHVEHIRNRKSLCEKASDEDGFHRECKVKLDGIPSWEYTVEEIDTMCKGRHTTDSYEQVAKRDVRKRIYKMLEEHGVPHWIKKKISVGAHWCRNTIRSNDTCWITFEESDKAYIVCKDLVSNGMTTETNKIRISWEMKPAGKKAT